MFHNNNKKTDAVAEAVKKILDVSESVESVEEDMHKPLMPAQKMVQKKVDAETKKQNPPKKQAGTNIAAAMGGLNKEEKSFKDRLIEAFKQKEKPEELLPDLEEEMSDSQKKKREEIVMSMKDKTSYFKKKYGAKWKNVMYATATKQAMGEQIVYDDYIYDRVVEVEQIDEGKPYKPSVLDRLSVAAHQSAIKMGIKKARRSPGASRLIGSTNLHAQKEETEHSDEAQDKKMVKKDCLKSEEVELDEGYSAHTHTVHFSDPESGEWKGKMLIVADNDNEAVDLAHDMAKDNELKVMKVSKNHLVMMDRTIGEDVDSEEEVIFESPDQDVDDQDITTDTLGGRVAGGKVNSFKNFKIKLKSDRDYQRAPKEMDSVPASTTARASITAKKWDPPSNVKTEEVEQYDEAKLPPLHKRTERQQIAHDLGLDQEYSKKYPGGEKQRAKDNTAFLKRFPPPKNEEVEQVDEKKKSHMLVVPKKPDPKTGRKDVKKIPSHMWAQMKDTHYQAEETEIEEGKDPSMDAGVGSEPIFVQNANTSSNPSPKHTPMSKAKELAHKSISKIKADLGRK